MLQMPRLLLVAATTITNGAAFSQAQQDLSIHISSQQTCVVGRLDVPCNTVGAKLLEQGTPRDAHIHLLGSTDSSYEAISSALTSLRDAGFTLKVGYINAAQDSVPGATPTGATATSSMMILQQAPKAGESAATVIPVGIRRGNTEYHVNCSNETDCEAAILPFCSKGYFPTAWESILSFDFACRIDKPAKQKMIPIFIRPECKWMFYGPDFPDVVSNGKTVKSKKRSKPDYVGVDPTAVSPSAIWPKRIIASASRTTHALP